MSRLNGLAFFELQFSGIPRHDRYDFSRFYILKTVTITLGTGQSYIRIVIAVQFKRWKSSVRLRPNQAGAILVYIKPLIVFQVGSNIYRTRTSAKIVLEITNFFRRIQKKGYDERMPPLIQQEKDILATLASEQEEIRRLAAVQRAAQVHRIERAGPPIPSI